MKIHALGDHKINHEINLQHKTVFEVLNHALQQLHLQLLLQNKYWQGKLRVNFHHIHAVVFFFRI